MNNCHNNIGIAIHKNGGGNCNNNNNNCSVINTGCDGNTNANK